MIFVSGCAVIGYLLGAQLAAAFDGGPLVGTTLGIIGAAVVSGVGVQLIRTLGQQNVVSGAQLQRHVEEINRLQTELDRERVRTAQLDDDNERLRRELVAARSRE